jgi:Trk-type K+ transport system membrane component
MEWLDKIVDFLGAAVGPNLHRYLLIVFLTGVGFMGYGVVSMSIRAVSDRVCARIKVNEQSRPVRLTTLVLSLAATAAVLWFLYRVAPVLSPLHYIRY